jgi:hypothetical protein
MARSVLALVWPWTSVQRLVDADWHDELAKNTQLASRSRDVQQAHRREYIPVLKERVRLLRCGMIGSFLFLVFAIVVAQVVILAGEKPNAPQKIWLGGLSIFCFAWATLARLGKPGTSFGGNTVIERLDRKIFWVLYWLGTFFGTLALA